jgi:hypothetical protein
MFLISKIYICHNYNFFIILNPHQFRKRHRHPLSLWFTKHFYLSDNTQTTFIIDSYIECRYLSSLSLLTKRMGLPNYSYIFENQSFSNEPSNIFSTFIFFLYIFLVFCIVFLTVCMLLFQFSYGTPVYKLKNSSCCKFLPFPCWRHCLKTIKIDESERYENVKALKKYFYKNAEILESIL